MTSAKMTRTLTHWGMGLGLACLAGCQPTPAPTPPPDARAMEQKSVAMRQTMMRADPGARVGVVETVIADQKWLAVGDAQVQNFQEGDWVSVFDPDGALLAQGEVRNIKEMSLHVKYDPAPGATRAPQSGDVVLAGQRPARPIGASMMETENAMPAPMMNEAGGMGMQPTTQPMMSPGGAPPMNDHAMPSHDAMPTTTPPAPAETPPAPAAETPAAQPPATETPAAPAETPAAQPPATETPAAPAPAETPAAQPPAAETPAETPAAQPPATETPAAPAPDATAQPAPETPAPAPETPAPQPEQNK